MTKFNYIENAWNIFIDNISEKQRKYIDSKEGYKGDIYCSFVSFVNNYIHGRKYFNTLYTEYDEEIIDTEVLTYSEAFITIMKIETSLTISKDIANKVIEYLRENKTNIEFFKFFI